jgi:carbonic anhydrase
MGLLTAALLLAALTTPISASCAHGTNLHPRSDVFVPPRYDYAGTTGPLNWHHLDPAWATCAEGTMQSPILLNTTTATQRRALKTVVPLDQVSIDLIIERRNGAYGTGEQEPVLENLGTTVEIILEGQLSALNKMWDLKQCHFHTPSEHRLEGEHYEAEMHCVHTRVGTFARLVLFSRVGSSS